jgi:hypothetical protein
MAVTATANRVITSITVASALTAGVGRFAQARSRDGGRRWRGRAGPLGIARDDRALAGDVHDAPVPGRQRIGVAGIEPPAVEEAVAFGGEHGRRAVVVTTERRRVLAVHVRLPAPVLC